MVSYEELHETLKSGEYYKKLKEYFDGFENPELLNRKVKQG